MVDLKTYESFNPYRTIGGVCGFGIPYGNPYGSVFSYGVYDRLLKNVSDETKMTSLQKPTTPIAAMAIKPTEETECSEETKSGMGKGLIIGTVVTAATALALALTGKGTKLVQTIKNSRLGTALAKLFHRAPTAV